MYKQCVLNQSIKRSIKNVKKRCPVNTKTAEIIFNNFSETDEKALKKSVKEELTRLISTGEITKKEAKDALKFLKENDLAGALVRRNLVEKTNFETLYGFEDLQDEKANALMKEAGLTISDLYDASKFAGDDYEIDYVKLSRKEKKLAENGEVTCSELKNIQNDLNEKIKANGGDKVLTEKETVRLMQGLGLSVEGKKSLIKAFLDPYGIKAVKNEIKSKKYKKAGYEGNDLTALKFDRLAEKYTDAVENGNT